MACAYLSQGVDWRAGTGLDIGISRDFKILASSGEASFR